MWSWERLKVNWQFGMHGKNNVVPSMPLAKTFVGGEVVVEVSLVQL